MNKCWNWFKASDQQRDRGEPSLVAGITRQIIDEYNVSDGRVYVAGMSAGGAMAAIMADTTLTSTPRSASIRVSPPEWPTTCPPPSPRCTKGGRPPPRRDVLTATATGQSSRTVPAIVFHGDYDKTVHPRNADHLLEHYCAAKTTSSRDKVGESTPRGDCASGTGPRRARLHARHLPRRRRARHRRAVDGPRARARVVGR